MIISLIAAVDSQFGIGKQNQLLCHLPADLRHFKETTLGKPIIMGRLTYESIGKPLPGRRNIVLSRQAPVYDGVDCYASLATAIENLGAVDEVMIIGGAQIYQQAIHSAQRLYLTHIHHQFDADVFFPKISPEEWKCIQSETKLSDEKNQFDLTFCVYEKNHKKTQKVFDK